MKTPDELAEAIAGLRSLPPVERFREAARLIDEAKAVLSAVRGAALAEAVAGGRKITGPDGMAAELEQHPSKLDRMLAAHRAAQAAPGKD